MAERAVVGSVAELLEPRGAWEGTWLLRAAPRPLARLGLFYASCLGFVSCKMRLVT